MIRLSEFRKMRAKGAKEMKGLGRGLKLVIDILRELSVVGGLTAAPVGIVART